MISAPRKRGATPRGQKAAGGLRKAYTPPKLELVGDVFDLVLGGSPGTGDSGPGFFTHLPPGVSPFSPPPGSLKD